MVERVDAQARPVAVVRERHRWHHLFVLVRDERVVHLQVETGIDDGAILGRERLGETEQERLLIPVVLIFGIGQRTRRRHHRQESRDALHLHEACLEIGDVALQLGRSGIGYCASDDRPARGAGIGEDSGVVFAETPRDRGRR